MLHLFFIAFVVSNPPADPAVGEGGATMVAAAQPHVMVVPIEGSDVSVDVPVMLGTPLIVLTPLAIRNHTVGRKDLLQAHREDKNPHQISALLTDHPQEGPVVLSITCTEGLVIQLRLHVGTPQTAIYTLRFRYSNKTEERIHKATVAARQQEREICEDKVRATAEEVRQTVLREFLRDFQRHFSANDDKEYERNSDVIVKVFHEIRLGSRGVLVFAVQNDTRNEIVIDRLEVRAHKTGDLCEVIAIDFADSKVQPNTERRGSLAFSMPARVDEFDFVLYQGETRKIVVSGIEF